MSAPRPVESPPVQRSAFLAAFLSALWPGLGQAYAGASQRGLLIAAPALLAGALIAGLVLRTNHLELLGTLLDPTVLTVILAADLLILVYRGLAIVDAWRMAVARDGGGPRRDHAVGLSRILSLASLAAVLAVSAGGHVAVAYYDLQAQQLDCIFDAATNSCGTPGTGSAATSGPGPATPTVGAPGATGVPGAPPSGTGTPTVAPPPTAAPTSWTGGRLNILVIGSDQRPPDPTFNTDTMIVVSIDPTTHAVAMFSLPRDTVNVPLPPGFGQGAFGPAYAYKINSLWTHAYGRPDLFAGTDLQRGFNALKSALGYLYGIPIAYYVEVNFQGFQEVIDTFGGVTINVQMPVLDDNFPGDNPGERGIPQRVYVPAGMQHMTGSEALTYARSRHGSNDFDRAARQQSVLVALRNQTDVGSLIPRLPQLIKGLRDAVHTDIPVSSLPKLLALAGTLDTTTMRSYVFAPPLYETEYSSDPFGLGRGYITVPNVSRIRTAVAGAFTTDPRLEALRQKVAQERPSVWVVDGSGDPQATADLASYLAYQGMAASAPLIPPVGAPRTTRIQVYNGAETRLPATLAMLQADLGVRPTFVMDHRIHVDVIVTTTKATPSLSPPPAP